MINTGKWMPGSTEAADAASVSHQIARKGTVAASLMVFFAAWGVFAASARLIHSPPAWSTFEFCQYAEIGRNLALEGRFETRLVEPMALAFIDRHGRPELRSESSWPVVSRYPLPALMVAASMRLLGPTKLAVACVNGMALASLATLLFLLARHWYGLGWAALACLLLVANPAVFGYFALLGTPDPLFAIVFLLELLAWSWALGFPVRSPLAELLVGLGIGTLAGLAYLSRFNAILFLAVQAGVLIYQRRWRLVFSGAIAFIALTSILFVYNYRHFGQPIVGLYSAWNLLDGIGVFPREPWLYYREVHLPEILAQHVADITRKWARNLFTVVPSRLWTLWELQPLWPLVILGAVGLAFRDAAGLVPTRSITRRFLAWGSLFFLLQLLVFPALRLEFETRLSPHHGRYFFWFAPVAVLLAISVLRRLSASHPLPRAAAALLILTQLALFVPTWRSWFDQNQKPINLERDPIRRMLAQVVPPNRLVASNQPQILLWACGLRSVSLPADPEELRLLNRSSPTPIDYIFVDLNFNCIQLDTRWAQLVQPRPGTPPLWESSLFTEYEYVFMPQFTRPILYVLMKRRGLNPSPLEQEMSLRAGPK